MPAERVSYYRVKPSGEVALQASEHEGLLIPQGRQDELPEPLEITGLRMVVGAVQPQEGNIVKVEGGSRWILDVNEDTSEDWSKLEFSPAESDLMSTLVDKFRDTFVGSHTMSPLYNAVRSETRSELMLNLRRLSKLPAAGKMEVEEDMEALNGIIWGLEEDGRVDSDEKKELVQDIRTIVGQAVRITQR
jgi:hypothetical protein